MACHLYDHPRSGNCYKVRLFASLIGLPLDLRPVDVLGGETRTEAFGTLNPKRQVPVLADGDHVVQDSQAILVYLAARYGPDWTASSAEELGGIVEWLSYAAKEVSNGLQMARLHFIAPEEGIDLARAQGIAMETLSLLDRELSQRTWLCMERPTIADLAVFPYVALAREGRLPLERFASIDAWIDRIRSLPGYIPMLGLPDAKGRT